MTKHETIDWSMHRLTDDLQALPSWIFFERHPEVSIEAYRRKLRKVLGEGMTEHDNRWLDQELPTETLRPVTNEQPNTILVSPSDSLTLGVISDTHLGSRYCDLTVLHQIYDHFSATGVQVVLHAGDLSDGQNMYAGHQNDLVVSGFDNHLEYLETQYPKRAGISTYLIAGNHDLSFKTQFGASLVQHLHERREDLIPVGEYTQVLKFGDLLVKIHHAFGGSDRAVSTVNGILANIPESHLPQLAVFGHWHTADHWMAGPGKAITVLTGGCTVHRSSVDMRRERYPALGGWTVTCSYDRKASSWQIDPSFLNFSP